MEYAHEENYKGYEIKIVYDEDSFSPDDDRDDGLFLVGYHRDFWIDRKRKNIIRKQDKEKQ